MDILPVPEGGALNLISAFAPPRAGCRSECQCNVVLVSLGLLGLALGVLVYLTDRDGVHAVLVPAVPALADRHLFGPLGPWLPSLAHAFAFSLFSAAALPLLSPWRYGACAAWFALDAMFEIGQHPAISRGLGAAIERGLGPTAWSRTLAHSFVGGRFDGRDIAAAGIGAIVAAGALLLVQRTLAQRTLEHDHGIA